jgi:iron complex outermembrane recepter protein
MTKRILLVSCAACGLASWGALAHAATADASSTSSSASTGSSVVTEIVVTAEKREQALQTVPIAITAFTSKERDVVGINSIQDMTNFTPGLTYSTSTDRITLRGVGRTTNVLSADAPVANYDDGLYETFAVAAGRSSLDLAEVEVERGPQGTLGGRNAEAGALEEITVHPSDTPTAEARLTIGNYDHVIAEGAVSGPINDVWKFRVYFDYEYQGQGWIQNSVPGLPSEGNNINEWYTDIQVAAHFNDNLDMWTKFQSAMWYNPSGGPGDQSDGWTPAGYPTYEWGAGDIVPLAGYACSPGFSAFGGGHVTNASPDGCNNPALKSPWTETTSVDHTVELPAYYSINTQWTWHSQGFDIKYIGGGTFYHYLLFGPTEGSLDEPAITSFTQPSVAGPGLVVNPTDSFEYEESNGFWSDELDFISTGNGPLQWVAGVYQFYQHYQQPVSAEDLQQPQLNEPLGAQSAVCFFTGGVCAPPHLYRWYDNRPDIQDQSYAGYGQIDWKVEPTLKLTLGVRYSYDNKYGTESVRVLCFTLPSCYTVPELSAIVGGLPAVDLSQIPTVVDNGASGAPPKGVVGQTTYSAITGLATRQYDGVWQSPSGTAGIEWTPDADSLYYFKYGHGYKSGGFNIGIFTAESFSPETAAEGVDALEFGAKHSFGKFLTLDAAVYWYNYTNLQIPIASIQTEGGESLAATSFLNVPKSISQGFELESTWTPIDHLIVLFNYSFDDAYVSSGTAADPADPNAIEPNAKPLYTAAQCAATASAATPDCTADVYSIGIAGDKNAGWNIPQNLAGNPLPNAPRNKIAIDARYEISDSMGGKWTPSVSYVWRDVQYGLFFKETDYAAPAWDEWDARVSYDSPDKRFEAILFIKNIANTVGFDQGALATRAAGTVDVPGTCGTGFCPVNYVQGLNGPAGFNQHLAGANAFGVYSTYYVTPPRTYGIELHYKFY